MEAGTENEARQVCIGLMTDDRLLYVVHVIWKDGVLRPSRGAGGKETL
jgi:uncharacterized DUF497 family protein